MATEINSRIRQQFAISIAKLALERGITLKELADILNLSYSGVSRWTRGETFPTPEVIDKLQDYFKVPIAQLLGEITSLESGILKVVSQLDQDDKVKVLDFALQHIPLTTPNQNKDSDKSNT